MSLTEAFVLTVRDKNQDRNFDAELRLPGILIRYHIMADEVEIPFEPDEGRKYCAVVPDTTGKENYCIQNSFRQSCGMLESAFK